MQHNELKQIQNNIDEMANSYIKNIIEFKRMRMDIFERSVKIQIHLFNDLFVSDP